MTLNWADTLPTNWQVRKLKYIADIRLSNADKKSIEGEQAIRLCNYVDVYKNDFIVSTMSFMEATATDSQIRELVLRAGDVLITKDSEEWSDIAVPAYVPADLPGVICGYHLSHIRPNADQVFGGYLFRAFAADGIADQFKVAANGITRYGISKDDISSALFPVPPLSEQHAIAAFLDRKTAEIDAVIAKKERLIALLHEERQALISRAVTRGLDAGAAMKDSGVEWLGEVPKHWAVERLKFCMRKIEQGWSPQCENRQAEPGEWGVLKVGCMNMGVYDESENKALPPLLEPELALEVRVGDVLMSRSNTVELVGMAGIVHQTQEHILLCDKLYRIVFDTDRLRPDYAVYLLRSRPARLQIERDATGASSSMKNISNETVRNLLFGIPPLEEQDRLVAHIRQSWDRIERVQAGVQTQINKLREYRQTLISAAVTGKIAVPQDTPVVVPVEPARKPNPYFRRSVFAAEIIDQLCDEPTFGHVKFQKCLYVAQYHLSVEDFEENYHRMAAGPYDNQMIRSMDSQLTRQKWFEAKKSGDRYSYSRLEKAGQHRKYFDGYFADKSDALTALLNVFRKMDTEQTEIVATLYAVWNDFLLRSEQPDDDRIVTEVLNNWHESKRAISEDRWRKALVWMRQKNLVPHGFGKPTRPGVKQGGEP